MSVVKLDNTSVRIPGDGPPTIALVNFRLVDSSNVDRVGWDDAGNLYVRFKKSMKTYCYLGVSRQRAVAAAHARSVGKYINERIKPYFEVVELG